MDPLTQILMQRAMAQGGTPAPGAPGLGALTQPSQINSQPTGAQANPAPQAPTTPQAQTPPLQQPGGQVPSVPPASAGHTNTPPEAQRYINAQRMMQAYRNNWTPNPLLVQAQGR